MNVSWKNTSFGNETEGANQTVNPLKRNEEVAKVEVTVLVLVLLLALAGNLCVLLAIHTTKHSQSRMYYFMKHLSIADLVVAIFQVLPQLIWDITFRFYGPDFLCRLMWSAWDPAAPREAMAFIIAMLLASLNSCCNPWIYMFFAGHLFHDLMQHFVCCSTNYLKSSQCKCERESSRKSNSSTYAIKSTSSQKSFTQTSTT
ncbi:hypothetical protein AGOR_G00136260 [Albula goreensis]|uniref:G-protein coupled receptors family 1 profile domain-containing protein n=1 Tax=Albula goreensis TaxID=1534307 RepID=A0A8T3D7J9_9TELE|nr:hypothetical protein AGOR_G00136260 [Albula goreensis]